MRSTVNILAAIMLPAAALAQLGADRSVSVVYNSNVVTNKGWERSVVMRHEPTGTVYNDGGTVGSKAEIAAANAAADSAADTAQAANDSMNVQLSRLNDASGGASTNAIGLALVVRPETTRTNLTFFVVKTETDGVIDTQYLWCNWNIVLPPNRFVVYQGFGQCTTNKMKFAQWTNTVTVTQNGRTWNGCHVGTVIDASVVGDVLGKLVDVEHLTHLCVAISLGFGDFCLLGAGLGAHDSDTVVNHNSKRLQG